MKQIKPTQPITMQLVIEVEPYHWSDRPTPENCPRPRTDHGRAQWASYFHECMTDAGIKGIKPIGPDSLFVDAFSIVTNEFMLRMIRECLEAASLPGFPDEDGREDVCSSETVSRLEGGYAIVAGDEVLLTPECCTDFSTLDNWKQALIDSPECGILWVGHPEAEIRFESDFVVVNPGAGESSELPHPQRTIEFVFDVEALRCAVDQAEDARTQFKTALFTRVKELVADPVLASNVTTWLMGEG